MSEIVFKNKKLHNKGTCKSPIILFLLYHGPPTQNKTPSFIYGFSNTAFSL
jgi:hypothetical protein